MTFSMSTNSRTRIETDRNAIYFAVTILNGLNSHKEGAGRESRPQLTGGTTELGPFPMHTFIQTVSLLIDLALTKVGSADLQSTLICPTHCRFCLQFS
jgi:hypothetical protein